MTPRVVFRTHYQIDEPIYVGIVVSDCTSPTRSEYSERVAERFVKAVGARDRHINRPAAGYAVDLARGLGVINEHAVWTDLGMLVHLFARKREGRLDDHLDLDETERLLYARIFLQGDGAAMLFVAQYLQAHDSVPNSPGDWNSLAKELFLSVYGEYLKISSTTADRVTLRNELDRIRSNGYQGKSGPHKCFVHLQSMARIGLLEREDSGGGRRYKYRSGLNEFVAALGNVVRLEEIAREGRWVDITATLAGQAKLEPPDKETLRQLIALYYSQVVDTGVALCSLRVLTDAVQLRGLQLGRVWPGDSVIAEVQSARQAMPKSVRLHVDRSGKPAFVRLNEDVLTDWGGGVVSGV